MISKMSPIYHLSKMRATIVVWTLTFCFKHYHWILLSLMSLSVTPNSHLFSILGPDHSGTALIMLLHHIKIFNVSTLLNQVHILQISFRVPKIWIPATQYHHHQEPVLFLVDAFKILYGDPCPLLQSIWFGTDPFFFG